MLNLEMVGWQPETEGSSTITVLDDPNEEMSHYMEDVVREYVPTAVVRSTTCGVRFISPYPFLSHHILAFIHVPHVFLPFILRYPKPNLTNPISMVARIIIPGLRSAIR
jgi:hypothetical protein